MIRLWHSPQKLCFYNSSNNNSINNSIGRTKKFWQNSEYKKSSIQLRSVNAIIRWHNIFNSNQSTSQHEYICISTTEDSSSHGSNQRQSMSTQLQLNLECLPSAYLNLHLVPCQSTCTFLGAYHFSIAPSSQ